MKLLFHLLEGLNAEEVFGFALFVGTFIAVYIAAAIMLLDLVVRAYRNGGAAPSRRYRLARMAVLGLAGTGLACMAYGYLVEPYWLEVNRVSLLSAKLPTGSGPVRIVHVSDLHCDPSPRLEEELPKVVAREKPDLIVFTGDAINSPGGLPIFKGCISKLAAIAPTFAVKGNWDALYWNQLSLFDNTGVRQLDGDAEHVSVRGADLWVAGAPVGPEELRRRALAKIPAGAFVLFLYHYPSAVLSLAEENVDLLCAGHTHGGQVALPLYGALVTLSKLGKAYESGLHRLNNTWLYVNRGIGMEGGAAPRVRFCARPEVTVIELNPARLKR